MLVLTQGAMIVPGGSTNRYLPIAGDFPNALSMSPLPYLITDTGELCGVSRPWLRKKSLLTPVFRALSRHLDPLPFIKIIKR